MFKILFDNVAAGDIISWNAGFQLDVSGVATMWTVNAISGFQDNGTPGIDDTFNNADGDVVTVSGGIITAITTP